MEHIKQPLHCRGFSRLSLKQQIWLVLGTALGVLFAIDLGISYQQLRQEMHTEAMSGAREIYGVMKAVRDVYQKQFLDSGLPVNRKTIGLLPEHAFTRIGVDSNWSDIGIILKNVTDRPRNPGHVADSDEQRAMEFFRNNPEVMERVDEIVLPGRSATLLVTAPIWIDARCLLCHGKPEDAPPDLIFDNDQAFGYQVGDLRGLLSIRIPTDQFNSRFWRIWGNQLLVKAASYVLLLFCIGLLLEHLVLRRLDLLRNFTHRIAAGRYDDSLPIDGKDEIAELAEDIRGMAKEIKCREEKLHKLSLAIEQSPESVVITDLNGDIEYVNAAFLSNTGYSMDEIIGQNPRILQSGKTPRQTYAGLWQVLAAGNPWHGELVNRRKDGSEYIESVTIAPLRQEDGRVTHYVAVKLDITELKHIAEELKAHRQNLEELVERRTQELNQAKEQAEEANRAKSSFLANMSHEIRTPLNAITGMAHLIRRGQLDPLQRERLLKLENAGSHLLQIINSVLDLSKIESGKLVLERTEFHLESLFSNLTSILQEKFDEKGLRFERELPQGLPPLLGDPTRLQQALLNYLGNALKFTEHGRVRLLAEIIDEDSESLLIKFVVDDTGIGIPADAVARLFAAFEQADNSTTRKYGGTGLGLALVRKFATAMGGDAGVGSVPGQGSSFWMTARLEKGQGTPVQKTDYSNNSAECELRQRHAGARILLAEDEPINREIIQLLLEEAGLLAEVVENGEQAVAIANRQKFDLILMDMQMPVMDGLKASRAILSQECYANTPIIAITANAFAEDKHACQQAGMVDFVAKPIVPGVFYATLLKCLNLSGQG